jgi:DNA-binding IclR family transcriptional regulator
MPRLKSNQKKKPQPTVGGVQTLLVAAKILDAVAHFRGPVRLTDLARMLRMTLPRISRHVATLRSLGFIEKAEPSEAYRLGTKLLILGQVALEQTSLASVAYGHVHRLRDQLGHTILLVGNSNEGAVVLMCVASNHTTSIVVHPGTRLDFPETPSARLFYAFDDVFAAAEKERLKSGLGGAKYDEEELLARLNRGLAGFYDYEFDVQGGIGSISAPIFNHRNRIVATVALLMASSEFNGKVDDKMLSGVKDCAARISSALGSQAWDRREGATKGGYPSTPRSSAQVEATLRES